MPTILSATAAGSARTRSGRRSPPAKSSIVRRAARVSPTTCIASDAPLGRPASFDRILSPEPSELAAEFVGSGDSHGRSKAFGRSLSLTSSMVAFMLMLAARRRRRSVVSPDWIASLAASSTASGACSSASAAAKRSRAHHRHPETTRWSGQRGDAVCRAARRRQAVPLHRMARPRWLPR